MDLFDQFQKFKTNLKTQIEHRPHSQQRNTVLKSNFIQQTLQTQQQQISDVQRKKTLQHHRSSTLFSAAKENQDKLQKQNQQQQRFTMVHKQLPEVLSMQQIQQISDVLIDCSEGQINSLSTQYVEELVKLSSIIMYKVKNSKFYS
ncbi:unnamed protein product (macronuclear) [Paramecium tetraurelia]|uniref:Uncharacterized protein n=1 Tax=Paramecium tetraurelia TaxID=5888 RepID=A0DJR7_PARTE|nr:uncharacterized protein GSPATT00017628001 [Paramecium tetraurelia]CAK83284.1 unnamed protein product [Paramecium tetraurelia]|eukprot:XP_001450681.1 hypothetical protein (macronuclear) [Paramecium tetraurelia strain d4-2]